MIKVLKASKLRRSKGGKKTYRQVTLTYWNKKGETQTKTKEKRCSYSVAMKRYEMGVKMTWNVTETKNWYFGRINSFVSVFIFRVLRSRKRKAAFRSRICVNTFRLRRKWLPVGTSSRRRRSSWPDPWLDYPPMRFVITLTLFRSLVAISKIWSA